jgi:enoyl-CoA hydratase
MIAESSVVLAGADIKEISALDAEGARKVRYLEDLCHGLSSFRKPLIAAVEGMAVN